MVLHWSLGFERCDVDTSSAEHIEAYTGTRHGCHIGRARAILCVGYLEFGSQVSQVNIF